MNLNNLITFILGAIIFMAFDTLFEKKLFNTEFFNIILRKHRNFQLMLRIFLILWIVLSEITALFFKYGLNQPGIAWVVRGIFIGLFFRLIKYKEKL